MKRIYSLILGFALTAMFTACSDSDNDGGSDLGGDLVLKASVSELPASEYEQVTFTVMAGDKDVTSYCKIWDMTGNAEVLPGKTFSTTEPGTYKFVAKYESDASNEVTVTFTPMKYFVKNLMLEYVTSTECGNCPAMTHNIKNLIDMYPEGRVHWLAFHYRMQYLDPFQIGETMTLMNKWGAFFPNTILDATETFGESVNPDAWQRQFKKFLGQNGEVGIAINSSVSGNDITIEVSVKSLRNFPEGAKLGVFLSENYLQAKQTDYSQDSKEPVMMSHDNVVRKCLTYVLGDMLDDDVIAYNKEHKQTFTYTKVSKDDWNLNNMDVTVCVMEGAKDKVINSQRVQLGKSIGFQYAGNE